MFVINNEVIFINKILIIKNIFFTLSDHIIEDATRIQIDNFVICHLYNIFIENSINVKNST